METPKLQSIEQVSEGWVNKYVLTYLMGDGRLHSYEMVSRKKLDALRALLEGNAEGRVPATPDAVSVVARTPRDTLVMEREFRYPLNSWCIAFPAGLVDPGEDIVTCAARELSEETGYEVIPGTTPHALPQAGYSSTGLTDETVHIVYMQAEKARDAHTEPNELIEVFELPIADIDSFLQENTTPIGVRAQLILEAFRQAR